MRVRWIGGHSLKHFSFRDDKHHMRVQVKLYMGLAAIVLLIQSPTVFSDVVLLPPAAPSNTETEFPESYFGIVNDEKGSKVFTYDSTHESARVNQLRSIASAHSGVQEVALIASRLGYFPEIISVTRDIPVTLYLISDSKKALCFMMDGSDFDIKPKQIRSNEISEIRFVPKQVGTHRFYCPINGIEGTLVVKDIHLKEKD